MSEVVELAPKPENREQAVKLLVRKGLSLVDLRYGNYGSAPKAYHNVAHTISVIDATEEICDLAIDRGKIKAGFKDHLAVAAAFHDVVQDHGQENEVLSAEEAAKEMLEIGHFNEIDIRTVQNAITATQLVKDNGNVVQMAVEGYLTRIVADADLASLGGNSETYLTNLFNLYEELSQTAEVGSIYKFIREQALNFNANHSFLTEEANVLFPCKQVNINFALEYVENNSPTWLD